MLEPQSPSRAPEVFGAPVEPPALDNLRIEDNYAERRSALNPFERSGSQSQSQGEAKFEIRVHDPDKKGDGMNAFITFRVTTKSSIAELRGMTPSVERRYSDFLWLHEQLSTHYRNYIVPPLPEKNSLSFNRFTPEFIEIRRRELEKFLRRVAEHAVLSTSPDFLTFLEAADEKFAAAKQNKTAPSQDAPKASGGFASSVMSLFGSAAQKVSSALGGTFEDSDPWFIDRTAYINQLDVQLSNLARASNGLGRRYKELVENYVDFGKSCSTLGDVEADLDKETSNAFMRISNIAMPVAGLYKDLADKELTQFEDSLRDHVRIVGAVKKMFEYRAEVGAQLQTINKEIDEKRERLKTAVSTAAKLTKEIADDEAAQGRKKEQFESVSKVVRDEFERFERTKAKEIREAVTKLIQFNMNLELQIVDHWKKFLANYQKDAPV
jgi:sorting nexin-1/2